MKANLIQVISAAACVVLSLGLQCGCKSSEPEPSPSITRQQTSFAQGAGAAALLYNSAKDASNALATIHISCPADPKYRLPGFAMKCVECHHTHSISRETDPPEIVSRDLSQACAANLKYIGLAARTWATNHNSPLPYSFTLMANELRSPSLLICPAYLYQHPPPNPWDPVIIRKPKSSPWVHYLARKAVNPWLVPILNEATYEIVSPWTRRRDPTSVYVRCPIHGTALRADGSVVAVAGTQ